MTPERWEQVGGLYHAAMELGAASRAAFLDEACAGDESLRREVESLIAAGEPEAAFIAEPAVNDAARMLAAGDASSLRSLPSLAGGCELGQYKILSLLGAGGMGEIYLARDLRLARQVALKLLPSDVTRDKARVSRFVKEARAVSSLNHPNIITIYDFGEAGGRRYLVTEFIEGQTIRQRISRQQIPLPEAMDIAVQIAGALAAAHAAGIIHRDIKPENVMVRPDGLVKVLDFGLAKLTESPARRSKFDTEALSATGGFKTEPGVILGTVAYMSPEQLRGEEVDARSDLFSLGVICYEMITGRRPFSGPTNSHLIVAILDHEPAPLSVPAELQRIVSRALSKNRESRYQSAEALLLDLKTLQQSFQQQAAQDTLRPPAVEQVNPAAEANAGAAELKTTPARAIRLLPGWFKSHRPLAVGALAGIILAAAALFLFANRKPALTGKDTVLLADWENKTGEDVFDETLRQALAVQLEQTPYLNLFPDDRVREALRYMGRPADERLTRQVAREICQRQGVKAMLTGSIARLDRNYSIILEAANSQTGETIAGALAEADGKDSVLSALDKAARQLRERLGESLASIQKFDAPLEQATTPSLEALKAWSRGLALVRSGKSGAIPLYKHATELDPNFAKAWVSLSLAYNYQEQLEPAAEFAAKAFALKDRVTERERFDITANYYAIATGDLPKAIEALELWKQTYPRDPSPLNRLASFYRLIGQFEKALAAAREAHQLNPRAYVPNVSMGTTLLQLNRFDEAQRVIEEALAEKLATATSRRDLFQIAAIKNDTVTMQQQIEWAASSRDDYWGLYWQAQLASFAGKLREAESHYARAATLVMPLPSERAAWFIEEARLRAALCGLCQQARTIGIRDAAPARISLQPYIPTVASRALTLALCNQAAAAQSLASELAQTNPQSTLANLIWLPVIRAAIELQRGNPASAIHTLQPATPYEPAALFWPNYLRGHACLRLGKNMEAAAEFQKILDHRGWDALSPLYPLAHLGLARAAWLTGDAAKSREAYRAFLKLWEEADVDIPIFRAVRQEQESAP
jgi:tetratricopeptide (TPR) repeat protein